MWTPNTWRTIPDPWNDNKPKDLKNAAGSPLPFDIAGEEYTKEFFNSSEAIDHARRDSIIESIRELDETRKEYIKRLIIDEDRLDVLMKLIGYRAPAHQMMLNDFFDDRQFGIALAPRGSGKSTSCDICYAVMRALQNRNLRVLIASRTTEQAKAFLFEIKSALMNERLREIFGELRGDKWDETQADIAGRTKNPKEHTFTIAGADGAVVSKHFDLILGDDLVEDKNSRTEGQRKQLMRFFYRSMLPTLRPDGEMRLLGTRYHPEDLYGHLINNDPLFKDNYIVLPAVFHRKTGETLDLLQDDNGNFYASRNATCYDPKGFPMKKIIERRASMPLADFECQYQNRTTFMQGDFFKTDWFQHYNEDPHKMVDRLGLSVWMGVDLASSLKDSADEFAMVVIGILRNMQECYILDYLAGRFTFNKQKSLLIQKYDDWNPAKTFVEANAYQSVLSTTTVEEFPDIRVMPIWTTKDKITRARSMQLYYERRQMYHRKGRSAKIEGQLIGFPDLKLKDLVDALFFAINGAVQGGARKRRRADQEFGLF